MRRAVWVLLLSGAIASCGPASTGASTPSPSPASASALAAAPADFLPLALMSCPSPETGPFSDFSGAFRTGIGRHDQIAAVAAIVSQANADTWVVTLAAPDAKPEVCKGGLGFAYADRPVGKEPVAQSFIFVFKDASSAMNGYGGILTQLVKAPTSTGATTGLGPNSAHGDAGDIQIFVWLRGSVVSYLLTQEIDNWQAATKSIDSRLNR